MEHANGPGLLAFGGHVVFESMSICICACSEEHAACKRAAQSACSFNGTKSYASFKLARTRCVIKTVTSKGWVNDQQRCVILCCVILWNSRSLYFSPSLPPSPYFPFVFSLTSSPALLSLTFSFPSLLSSVPHSLTQLTLALSQTH
jgi:hypothetical protein